jgi:hypothetical protein
MKASAAQQKGKRGLGPVFGVRTVEKPKQIDLWRIEDRVVDEFTEAIICRVRGLWLFRRQLNVGRPCKAIF